MRSARGAPPSVAHVAHSSAALGSSPPSPLPTIVKGQQPRGRFIRKAACAAASLTGLVVAAPLLLGGNEAVAPALAEETRRSAAAVAPALAAEDVASKYEYVKFDVQLSETESGSFIVEVRPDWAPLGAARFTTLSKAGFFKDCRFFRVIDGFIAQVSIIVDRARWRAAPRRLTRFYCTPQKREHCLWTRSV